MAQAFLPVRLCSGKNAGKYARAAKLRHYREAVIRAKQRRFSVWGEFPGRQSG